jgi:predicted DsbA family dithiol-disulfide isomerase
MLSLEGAPTSSNLNNALITPNMGAIVRLSQQYASEAGAGGNVTYYSGALALTSSIQEYDLGAWATANNITGGIEIKSVFYQNLPAENSGAITTDYLVALGQGVGITSDKFKSCVANLDYKGWVNNVAASGGKANVNSTPTVFVDGKEIRRATSGADLGDYFDPAAFAKAVEGK